MVVKIFHGRAAIGSLPCFGNGGDVVKVKLFRGPDLRFRQHMVIRRIGKYFAPIKSAANIMVMGITAGNPPAVHPTWQEPVRGCS